jgi:hypothetical protein
VDRQISWAIVAICLTICCGCRPGGKTSATYDLDPQSIKVVELPAAHKIEVEFSTPDKVPVTAYLVNKEDADAAESAAIRGNVRDAIKAVKKPGPMLPNASSGKLLSPRSDKKTIWFLLFVTQKPTSVSVNTNRD